MAHLTAIIDQITRMENSLVNILLETAVKLSTLTDANIFVMVESAGGRKWAGRKSLRDEYVRGMLKPSTKDVEVTETVSSMPQEEFSMGSLMGMASGGCDGRERVPSPDIPAQPSPIYGAGPAVFPMAQQQPLPPPPQQLPQHQQPQQQQPREMADAQPSAAKRPRISAAESSPSINLPSSLLPAAAATAAKVLNASNNNIASSPPHHRRKSPNRDTVPQPVIMDGGRASPIPPSTNNRQETISKNLKDEFNGDEHPPDDAIVIKEELGRIGTPRGGGGGGGVGGGGGGGGGGSRGIDDAFEDEDPEASVDGGSGSWGEVALAGPSGLQQDSDANQPYSYLWDGDDDPLDEKPALAVDVPFDDDVQQQQQRYDDDAEDVLDAPPLPSSSASLDGMTELAAAVASSGALVPISGSGASSSINQFNLDLALNARLRHGCKFNPYQSSALQNLYNMNPYPSGEEKRKIADLIGITESQACNWFQNRRNRDKMNLKYKPH